MFDPGVKDVWKQLFDLRLTWPFALPGRVQVRYFFNDNLYPRPQVDYFYTGMPGSGYDVIFKEFDSVFSSKTELLAAEQILDELFENIAEASGPRTALYR